MTAAPVDYSLESIREAENEHPIVVDPGELPTRNTSPKQIRGDVQPKVDMIFLEAASLISGDDRKVDPKRFG